MDQYFSVGTFTGKKEFPHSPCAPHDVFVIYPHAAKQIEALAANERIGIKPYQVASLLNFEASGHYVIHQTIVVQDKNYYYLHCLLRAIDNNLLLSALKPEQCCNREDFFRVPRNC